MKRLLLPLLLLLPVACSEECQEDGIIFSDKQVQQRWDSCATTVVNADDVELSSLPEVLPVWLALGRHQNAFRAIEELSQTISMVQPSDTLSQMAYQVSLFADDPAWAERYANPIIVKCAEYYRNGVQNGDTATTMQSAANCYQTIIMAGRDEQGDYARMLSDNMDMTEPSSKASLANLPYGSRTQLLEQQADNLSVQARQARAIVQALVSTEGETLMVSNARLWEDDVTFNNIYSAAGVKVSGSIKGPVIMITMEAWRDADFVLLGERISLKKGLKTKRIFHKL